MINEREQCVLWAWVVWFARIAYGLVLFMCTPNRVPPIPKTGGWPEVLNPDQQVGPSMIPYGKNPNCIQTRTTPCLPTLWLEQCNFYLLHLVKVGAREFFFYYLFFFVWYAGAWYNTCQCGSEYRWLWRITESFRRETKKSLEAKK